jgi:hypothetical protein
MCHHRLAHLHATEMRLHPLKQETAALLEPLDVVEDGTTARPSYAAAAVRADGFVQHRHAALITAQSGSRMNIAQATT